MTRLMRFGTGAVLLAATSLLGGCYLNFDDSGWSSDGFLGPPPAPADGYGDVAVQAVDLSGDLGAVRGFSGGIWVAQGTGWDGYSEVQLQSRVSGEWAILSQIEVDGGFGALVPGRDYHFEGWGDGGASGAPHVRVMGCSGPQTDEWDFDQYADQVDVRVDPSSREGWILVRVAARFQSWDDASPRGGPVTQQMDSTFEVQVR